MDIFEYLWMLVKAYNPNQYERLLERPMRQFIIFTSLVLGLAILLFIAFIVPLTFNYISAIPAKTAEVDQLQLNATVQADHEVVLLDRPHITIDSDANGTRTSDITLSSEGILYPRYLFFGTAFVPWNDITDLKSQTPTRDKVLAAGIIFLLPSIMFWFFLFSLVKLALILIVMLLLGYLLPKIFRHAISMKDVTKLALLTMPSLIIMDLGIYPLAPLFWWGLLLTLAFFFIGIALISEIKVEEPHKRKFKDI